MGRIKKEDVFYTLFKDFAKDITKAAEDYAKLLHDYPTCLLYTSDAADDSTEV